MGELLRRTGKNLSNVIGIKSWGDCEDCSVVRAWEGRVPTAQKENMWGEADD